MFRFDLEPVLRHREHLEQEAQRRVARVQRHIAALEEEIAACEEAREAEAIVWRREAAGRSTPARQALHGAWCVELRRRRGELETRRQRGIQRLAEERRALAAAHRELRKIELLRERALGEWREHQAVIERKFVDDLTVMRHSRTRPTNDGQRPTVRGA